ncbi:MAG: ABC transporter permease, partial [Tumebacillaceae bacterium]
MKFWIIAMKDVTLRLRDRRGLISLFLMPLLLTLILGSALGGVFNGEAVSMPKMTIAVYNGDNQNIGKLIVKDVLQSGDLKPFVTEKVVDSAAKVRETVAAGQADVGLIIPDFYSTHMYSINPVQMQVVQDPGKATAASIVQSIAQSFTDRMATDMGAASQANDDVGKAALEFSNPFDPKIVSEQLFSDTDRVFWHPDVAVIEQPIGEKPVSGKQYYAAAMAVMFLLFNATIGAKMILNERDTETLARMMSTPTSKLSILLGKFIGTVLFAILQFAALLLATRFGFGVS